MKQIYLTKKINELVSTILILLGLKEESIGLSTTSSSRSLINFDSRNTFGLYSFKAALVFLFLVIGIGNNAFGQITQRGSATTATNTTATLTISKPTGVISGDVLIVNISQYTSSATGMAAATATGWTKIVGATMGSSTYGTVLYRVADGTEGSSFSFTLTNPYYATGSIVAFTGVDTTGGKGVGGTGTGPFDGTTGTTTSTTNKSALTIAPPAITTTAANSAVILLAQCAYYSNTWSSTAMTTTSPGTLTQLYSSTDNSAGVTSVGAAWGTMATAGSTGTGSATMTGSNAYRGGVLIALKASTTPCSGTPAPGTTLASVNPVGVGSSTVLSLTNATNGAGVTYQWKSSTDGTTYSPISGATSATYAASPTVNTYYKCDVTCSGNMGTSTALQVTTTYCVSTGTSSTYYISNVTTTGGITNFNVTSTGATNGYIDNSSTNSCSQYAGSTINISIGSIVSLGTGLSVFVDWNNNKSFTDTGEMVASTNGSYTSLNPWTASFTVPSGTAPGNYRMRVVDNYNSSTPASCNTGISGETEDYTFTVVAIPVCTTPSPATALVFGTTSNVSIPGSFTAPSPAANGYLVIRSTSSTLSAGPVDGTSYAAAASLGGGTVLQSGTGITFTDSSLTSNTQYYYFVYAYNNTSCSGGPKYSTQLTNNKITCPAAPTVNVNSGLTSSDATVSWTASAAGGGAATINYTLQVCTDSGYTTNISGSPFSLGTSLTSTLSGLTPGTIYYYRIKANNGSCDSAYLNGTVTTAAALPTITSFTPSTACYTGGATITITGTNLTGATAVTFNGTAATSFTVVNATTVTAVYPAGVADGTRAITNPAGTATSGSTLTPLPTPATPTVSTAGTYCNSTTLTASTTDGATMYYQGTTPNGTSTATPSSSQSVSASNTYYFRTQSAGGCWSAQASAAVTINTLAITAQPSTTVQNKCQGVAATALSVTASASTGTLSYQWYSNSTSSNTGGTLIPGATSASYTPATALANVGTTYYYCVVSVSSGACSATPVASNPSGAITVTATPTITGGTAACTGQTLQLTGSGTANGTTPWASATTSVATITTAGLLSGVATGSSLITYKDVNGCTATSTVTVNQSPTSVTASSNHASVCAGSTVNLSTTSSSVATSSTEGFETYPPTGWTFINAGSGNAWAAGTTAHTGAGSMYYLYNLTYAANAWAITPAKSLVSGVTYTITYWYEGSGTTYPESLKLTVGTAATVAGQTTTLLTQASITNSTYAQATATFTPSTSGTYYFGLNCYSAKNENVLYVDDFTISGTVPATYAWTSSPSGFTSSSQNPTGVAVAANTTYTVTATGGSCSTTSSVAVTANALPTITVDNPTASVCAGGTGASITASGASTYSWTSSSSGYTSTSNSITVTPTVATTYTVNGTDGNGCVGSTTAVVSVYAPVAITAQPGNQVVLINDPASFAVTASGSGLTYQWEYSTNGTTWSTLTGETNATYSIASADASLNAYQYHCIVSGTCNTVTSNPATLTVGSVSITAQPTAQTVCSTSSATFSITTSGTVTDYQWQYSTNGTTWTNVSGETSSSLTLSSLTSANSATQYHCVLNGGAVTSNAALLTVYDAVAITTQPTSQTVCSNASSVAFTTVATGSGLTYQWQVSTNGTSWSNVTGATAATYTITSPTTALNGNQYQVIVSGSSPCSAVTSSAVTLTVNQLVAITTQPTAITQCSNVASATFNVAATGTGVTYQWQYSTNGTTFSDLSGQTASSLTLTTPATYAGNSFHCIVSGAAPCASVTSNNVVLTLTPSLGGTYTVGSGQTYATLTAAVAAYNAATCFAGNVVFSLTDATYSTNETFPITVNANSYAGSNTLTIVPASGNTATITGSNAASIIKLNGADNIIIDGSNNGTTSRNLTIANTNTGTSSAVVWLASVVTPLNGATNDTVKNTIITGNSAATTLGAIVSSGIGKETPV